MEWYWWLAIAVVIIIHFGRMGRIEQGQAALRAMLATQLKEIREQLDFMESMTISDARAKREAAKQAETARPT